MHHEKYLPALPAPPPYQNHERSNQQEHQTLANHFRPSEERMVEFHQFVARYESKFKALADRETRSRLSSRTVNQTFATKLQVLDGYEIVFICDDSGSMNTPLGNGILIERARELNHSFSLSLSLAGDLSGPLEGKPSRCKHTCIRRREKSTSSLSCFLLINKPFPLSLLGDELKQIVSIVVDLASVFDPDGVDIYFLNREPVHHVRNSEQLVTVFAVPPAGRRVPTNIARSSTPTLVAQGQRRSCPYFDVSYARRFTRSPSASCSSCWPPTACPRTLKVAETFVRSSTFSNTNASLPTAFP